MPFPEDGWGLTGYPTTLLTPRTQDPETPLESESVGPISPGDLSNGHTRKIWKAYWDEPTGFVILEGYGQLFYAPLIIQLSLAFDKFGNPFVAFTDGTTIYMWWYDLFKQKMDFRSLWEGDKVVCYREDLRSRYVGTSNVLVVFANNGTLYSHIPDENSAPLYYRAEYQDDITVFATPTPVQQKTGLGLVNMGMGENNLMTVHYQAQKGDHEVGIPLSQAPDAGIGVYQGNLYVGTQDSSVVYEKVGISDTNSSSVSFPDSVNGNTTYPFTDTGNMVIGLGDGTANELDGFSSTVLNSFVDTLPTMVLVISASPIGFVGGNYYSNISGFNQFFQQVMVLVEHDGFSSTVLSETDITALGAAAYTTDGTNLVCSIPDYNSSGPHLVTYSIPALTVLDAVALPTATAEITYPSCAYENGTFYVGGVVESQDYYFIYEI